MKNTTAAMTGKGSWSNPVNSIIRSHKLETSPALPQPDPPSNEEEVMVRSKIYKKLLWQMTVGCEAESMVVNNVYLGRLQRLQVALDTGEPPQHTEPSNTQLACLTSSICPRNTLREYHAVQIRTCSSM